MREIPDSKVHWRIIESGLVLDLKFLNADAMESQELQIHHTGVARMLKVWGRTNSLNVQKVLWTIAELDIPYERIEAGLQFGVVKTADYLAMNPNALVPTIDDGGFVLWESNVIVRYLAARYGMGTLCPEGVRERFLAERWMDWQACALSPAMSPAFMGLIRRVPQFSDPATIDEARQRVGSWLTILDGHLATREFVNGERLTMGDIPVGVAVHRWYAMPVARDPHPNVERWFARLKERPGYRAHVELPLS